MPFGPERDGPEDEPAPFLTVAAAVDPPVAPGSSDGVGVVGPDAVTVDQGALPGTVGVMLDRRDRNYRLRSQRRSDAMAVVLSLARRS